MQTHTLPRADVFSNDAEYLVVFDIPGVPTDAIDLQIEDGVLLLTTGLPADEATTGTMVEHGWWMVPGERRFQLPDDVDADGVSADAKHGELRVRLPRKATNRKVAIGV